MARPHRSDGLCSPAQLSYYSSIIGNERELLPRARERTAGSPGL
jgi:hypothetical protein